MAIFPLPSVDGEDSAKNGLACQTHSSAHMKGTNNGSQGELCDVWRDIHGANNWNGLLDPINPILKAEALRYGDFAQLCYDAFDGDTCSKYYGTSKFSKRQLLEEIGMSNSGYRVTRYIYANTDLLGSIFGEKSADKSVWLGFVAVSTDPNEIKRLGRRDIVIAWRGTQTTEEWIQDLRDLLVPARLSYKCERTSKHRQAEIPSANGVVRIERGFLSCYTSTIYSQGTSVNMSTRDLVSEEIRRLLKVYENEIDNLSITFTGHSLGAALATLSAYDIKQMLHAIHYNQVPVTVFSFASPRVGNLAFAQQMENIGVKVLRFVNQRDVVPRVPGVFMNENMGFLSKLLHWLPWTYFHVGVKVCLKNNSPLLKPTHKLAYFHNLEVYLHLLDGYVGHRKPYSNSYGRDPALVNKSCDILIDDFEIPPKWCQQQNKGLIKGPDGKWKQPTRSLKKEEEEEEEEEEEDELK
ncbi:hypothetical protein KI387_028765 [Taxus chinensis]|uniref:Fungal lipase-type domain-containing protein n=2 Tax=Taxus chinensis TaxID=29808 RepID=A0AA38FC77_TAXCH|nr:hypothetical protein KI387_028765 [Taxus chinensis]